MGNAKYITVETWYRTASQSGPSLDSPNFVIINKMYYQIQKADRPGVAAQIPPPPHWTIPGYILKYTRV